MEIVRRFESGEMPNQIAKALGCSKTNVRYIIKLRGKLNKFKQINQAFGSTTPECNIKMRSSAIGKSVF